MLPLDDDGVSFTKCVSSFDDWGDDIVKVVSWIMWATPIPDMKFLICKCSEKD